MKETFNSDGQQFYQYQLNEQYPLIKMIESRKEHDIC